MTSDRERLLNDLQRLRAVSVAGALSPQLIRDNSPVLCGDYFSGYAETFIEWLEGLDVDARYERYLDAVLVAFGFCQYKGNQTDRWTDYLDQQFPNLKEGNPRTARRWCDKGFELIADLLLKESPSFRPGVVVYAKPGSAPDTVVFTTTYEYSSLPGSDELAYEVLYREGTQSDMELVVDLPPGRFSTPELNVADKQAWFRFEWSAYDKPTLVLDLHLPCEVYFPPNSVELSVG